MREGLSSQTRINTSLDDMESWIRSWDNRMLAKREFYDTRKGAACGAYMRRIARALNPPCACARRRVFSLLFNEEVKVICESQRTPNWIRDMGLYMRGTRE